ncbi:cation diffusion facilitator family transporter [Caldimonas sp. KR1-144]|uniref:cation diffusion facilitator family transporter n=1 Tax=Caldimonas sp. KR1-144 TaxID=3400911 RepID=UPI003C05B64F
MQVRGYLKLSIVAALATIALKTAAWWWTGSVGLLSDALESFVNLAAATFGLWMVTVAARPADEDHPFGHAKAEYFSSGFEALLILGAALGIGWAAIDRLLHPAPIEQVGLGIALSIASSVINGALAWVMLRASREHHSIALEADARHLMTDVYTSVGVIVGVLLVAMTGWLWIDPLLALLVAANITREAFSLLRRSTDGLMDRALDADEQRAIEDVLAGLSLDQVQVNDLRTRRAGAQRFCELHLHVPAAWTIGRAMRLRERVAASLLAAVPRLRVTIEVLPVGEEPLAQREPLQDVS